MPDKPSSPIKPLARLGVPSASLSPSGRSTRPPWLRLVVYRGRQGQDTRWFVEELLERTDEQGFDHQVRNHVQILLSPGEQTAWLLFSAVTSCYSLMADSSKLPELVALLDEAADNREWRLPGESGNLEPPPAWVRALFNIAARTLEDKKRWTAPDHRAWEAFLETMQAEEPSPPPSLLSIPSAGHYAALQEILAKGKFERVEGTRFPRALIDKGGVRGHAEMRPITPEEELLLPPAEAEALARKMWEQRGELSDKDADALDAVSACWLQRTRGPEDRVPIYIDEILQMRQLKPKRGGAGRRGGFEPEQRAEVFRSLLHLQSLWLEISDATVYEPDPDKPKKTRRHRRSLQSRAFVMTDRVGQARLDGTMDVEAVLVTPGSVFGRFLFGPGRQVALLSAKALHYDPFRQRWEKRLVRYLSWQWRIGASRSTFVKPFHVRTLLEEIGLEVDPHDPAKTRIRFENCLDALLEHGDIAAWQYERWDEENLPRRGWLPIWMTATVCLEAPESIKEAYRAVERTLEAKPAPARTLPAAVPTTLGERVRDRRRKLKLSQLQAAEELGVSQPYLSQIEKGTRSPAADVETRILEWLAAP